MPIFSNIWLGLCHRLGTSCWDAEVEILVWCVILGPGKWYFGLGNVRGKSGNPSSEKVKSKERWLQQLTTCWSRHAPVHLFPWSYIPPPQGSNMWEKDPNLISLIDDLFLIFRCFCDLFRLAVWSEVVSVTLNVISWWSVISRDSGYRIG